MKIKQYKKLNNTAALKKAHAKCKLYCHKYIRARDIKWSQVKGYYFICAACGKFFEVVLFSDKSIYNGKQMHASHYFDSEQYASVRYDERNIHLCCSQCNRHKHGNKEAYAIHLWSSLKDDFHKLQIDKNKTKRWDIVELEKLADEYKLKLQLRSAELQIKI